MTQPLLHRALLASIALAACEPELAALAPPALDGEAPVDPAILCRAQHPDEGTPVVVGGEAFAPVVFGLPGDPSIELPDVALLGAHDVYGDEADVGDVLYAGAPGGENAALLSWQSEAQLTFAVQDEVALDDGVGAIPAGLYDVRVTNADGQAATAPRALAITEVPVITAIDPLFTCVAQGAREIVLSTTDALRVGEALPAVDVGGVAVTPALTQCAAIAHDGLDAELCGRATIEIPQDALAPGAHAVVLTNPAPATCATAAAELVVVPPPVIEAIAPDEVCAVPGEIDLVVSGTGFLRVDGADLAVRVDGVAVAPSAFTGCAAVAVDGADVQTCTGFTLRVDPAAYPTGSIAVEVLNPAPGDCGATAHVVALPPPVVSAIAPAAVCSAAGTLDLTVTGSGFARLDGVDFAVTVGGATVVPTSISGCTDVTTADGRALQVCDAFVVSADASAQTGVDVPVAVTNPAGGCGTTENWLVAPPPAIASVAPDAICAASGNVDLVVAGTDFLRVDGAPFAVTVDGTAATPTAITGCAALDATGASVESCTGFTVTVDRAAYDVGAIDVRVENLVPGACADQEQVVVAPQPVIASIAPPTACREPGPLTLTVTGTGFARIDGTSFTVDVGGQAVVPTNVNCTSLPIPSGSLEVCDSFEVTVDPSAFAVSDVDVTVTNPTGDSCSTTADWLVFPAPVIASADPNGVCETLASTMEVTVTGSGFLRVGGTDFTVTVAGDPVVPTSFGGCTPVSLPGITGESCTSFVVSVDASAYPVGGVTIAVTNPAPAACATARSDVFEVFSPPTITAIVPAEACADVLTTFEVQGTELTNGTIVTANGVAADSVVANADGTALTVTYEEGLPAGTYDVTVSNGGCEATAAGALTVNPSPLVFFVDPPVVYNGIQIEATVFVSDIDEDAANVEIIDALGTATSLSFASPDRPQRIQATIPALVAPGEYAVRVTSADGCRSALDGRVAITDQTTIDVVTVDPKYVSPTRPTAVTVTVADTGAALVSVPRVYLSPAAGGTAVALRAVELFDDRNLSAVVTGAAPGTYTLIVVNPTGEVGVEPDAVVVTVNEPPLVTSVAPGSLDANSTTDVIIRGASFDAGAGPAVTFECVDFETGAAVASPTGTVNSATADTLDVTVNGSSVPAGAVCIVVVTNADGAAFRYSAISYKEPAQNLNPFLFGTDLVEGRRGLVLTAGRPTETSRFLYAIGGDDGTTTNAKTSVESAQVDAFGGMGAWSLQRNDLSNARDASGNTASYPRTFAGGATIGRFLYVVGGDDGGGAEATVLRAQVLDPLAGPEIDELDAALGDGATGLDAGLYLYRVSALFPTTDESNPGGESLPGELFNVEVPVVADKLVLTLSWAAVTGASGYRLYRTPAAGGTVADLQLLAELSGGGSTTYVDDGTDATDAATTPLPPGSLGVWHEVSTLTARAEHAVVTAPGANDAEVYLYAVGGRLADGTVTGGGEVATVTISPDGSQAISSWRTLTPNLSPARRLVAGMTIRPEDTPVAGDDTFLFFSGGRVAAGTVTNATEGGRVGAGGDIEGPDGGVATSWTNLTDPNPGRAGAAGLSANGFLFLFGGANGAASNSDFSNELVTATPSLGANWDALGDGSMQTPRLHLAATQESAFFFVAGGTTTGGAVLRTTERTIQ